MKSRNVVVVAIIIAALVITSGCINTEKQPPTINPTERPSPSSTPDIPLWKKDPLEVARIERLDQIRQRVRFHYNLTTGEDVRKKREEIIALGDSIGLKGWISSSGDIPKLRLKDANYSKDYYDSETHCLGIIPIRGRWHPDPHKTNMTRVEIKDETIGDVDLISMRIGDNPPLYVLPEIPREYIEYLAVCIIDHMTYLQEPLPDHVWERPLTDVTNMTEEEIELFVERYNLFLKTPSAVRGNECGGWKAIRNEERRILFSPDAIRKLGYHSAPLIVELSDKGFFPREDCQRIIDDLRSQYPEGSHQINHAKFFERYAPVRADYVHEVSKYGALMKEPGHGNRVVVIVPLDKVTKLARLPFVISITVNHCFNPEGDPFHCFPESVEWKK